jgi:CheY-like chemotaxis protein
MTYCVLLVDDNPTNLDILASYLEPVPHLELHFAETGQAALLAAARKTPDLVLTDWDLPDMSGLDIAKHLHHTLSPCPPIIAITGHSRADIWPEGQAWLTDALEKPISHDQLLASLPAFLRQNAVRSQSPEAAITAATEDEPPGLPLLNAADLNRRLNHNHKLIARVLEQFQLSQQDNLQQLGLAFSDQNWGQAGRLAHSLKGTGANLGLEALSAYASQLEALARIQQPPQAALLANFEATLTASLAAIKTYLAAMHSPAATASLTTTSLNSAERLARLKALSPLLDDDLGEFQDQLEALETDCPNDGEIKVLIGLFNQFDLARLAQELTRVTTQASSCQTPS